MPTKFGARHAINSAAEDLQTRIDELTRGEGVSVAIEAVGLPETYRLGVEAVAYCGRVVYIGYAKDETTYDTKLFVAKELDILGSRNALLEFPTVIQMLEGRERKFTDLITHRYPFAETIQAFADWDVDPGRFTKTMVDMDRQ